jgi:hypothetical protein
MKRLGLSILFLTMLALTGWAQMYFPAAIPSSAPTTQSINFSWGQSTDPLVVGYNIYYGTSSGIYTNEVSMGNATSGTISGLVAGTTYYFAVTAVDSLNQESYFSDEIHN